MCFESSMYHGVMPRSWRRGRDVAVVPRDSDRCASRTWQSCTGVSFRPVTARRPPGQPVQGPLASLTPLIGVATRPATEPGPLRVRAHPQ